jgi:hypothetical protein
VIRLGQTSHAAAAVVAGAFAAGTSAWAAGGTTETPPADPNASESATWDQVASIRGAAERIGRLHRARGAKAAYELVENCYKTHSLAPTYGEGFEACIAQDYLETRTLIQVYSRMPPDALEKLGVPSPHMLAQSMGQRVSMAFGQYKKSQAYADNVRKIVDEHGLPVFLSIVFPEAVRALDQKNTQEKKQ